MSDVRTSGMLQVGTMLRGTYRIEKHLGSGGFGNTYLARNTAFDEICAIKEFFIKGVCERNGDTSTVSVSNSENTVSFEQQRGKFKKEARRLRSILNEHVIRVHDLFEENGTAYYVMDFVDGDNLSEVLSANGRGLPEPTVRAYLRQILDGLAAIHAAGIWHLDIKPGNIMLDRQGCVKLIDFGASKQSDAEGTVTTCSAICYTPGYAPNEQITQSYDKFGPWTDFYALGATVYRLLTNRKPPLPTDLSEDETEDKHKTLPMPGVSDQMRRLVVWMMQENRLRRPASVAEITRRMDAAPPSEDEDTKVITPPVRKVVIPSTKEEQQEHPKKKYGWLALVFLAALGLSILGYSYFDNQGDSGEPLDTDRLANATEVVDTLGADSAEAPPERRHSALGEDGAPLLEGLEEEGRGGYGDDAEGYFGMCANTYMTGDRTVCFDGAFSDGKRNYPIQLEFVVDDNWFPGVCRYYNVDYGTKLTMSVRFTEDEMIVSGKAGGGNFVMHFTPTTNGRWRGTAQNGGHYLDAEIRPR